MKLRFLIAMTTTLGFGCMKRAHNPYPGTVVINQSDDGKGKVEGAVETLPEGPALYETYCSGCHGSLVDSSKRGKTAAEIKSAITHVPKMGHLNLNDDVIQKIADALRTNGSVQESYGMILYRTTCAPCHLPLEMSTKKNVTYESVWFALSVVEEMKSIVLTNEQIRALVDTLKSPETANDPAFVYKEYCSSCHGPLESSAKSGVSMENIAFALANVQAMRGIVLSQAQIEGLAKVLGENARGLAFKVVLGSRTFLADKFKYLYAESGSEDMQDQKILELIDKYILSQVSTFGGPCRSFVDESCPKDGPESRENATTNELLFGAIERMPFIRNTSHAPIHADITSSRLGYIIQVCGRIHDIEKSTLNVLTRSGLTPDADPLDLTSILKVWNAVNPVVPMSAEIAGEFYKLMQTTKDLGLSRIQQWRVFSEQVCQAGVMDFI